MPETADGIAEPVSDPRRPRTPPFDPRVLRLVPAARGPLVGLLALGVAAGLTAVAQAFAVAAVLVALVQPARGWDVMACLGWAIGAFVLRGALAGATEIVAAHAGAVVSGGLRAALARVVLARPVDLGPGGHGSDSPAVASSGAERPAPADADRAQLLLTSGAASVEPYVARYLPTLVGAAVLPPAVIVAMAWLDPVTAIIPIFTLPLLPLFAALIGSATADATATRWRTLAQLSGHFLDVMRGLPVLVGYGRATHQAGMVREVSERHRRATVSTLRLAFLSSAALELLATISVAIVAVWVGIHLAEGRMELWPALPLILLAPEAYWPIRRVGAEFHSAADGAQALADIAAELETPLTPFEPGAPVTPGQLGQHGGRSAADGARPSEVHAVGVDRLGYRYAPDLPWVLRDVEARLTRGLTVVTGPSGAGKTTLLELIAGLRTPSAGTIRREPAGRSDLAESAALARGDVHLVTQRPFLVPGTIAQNLTLGSPDPSSHSDADLSAALRCVGLDELVARGLDTALGDEGFGLSAGQRARLAIARAGLSDAAVLLLDEPTAHLDPDAEAIVHGYLERLAADRIVVAVTHRRGLVERADAHLRIEALTQPGRDAGSDDGLDRSDPPAAAALVDAAGDRGRP